MRRLYFATVFSVFAFVLGIVSFANVAEAQVRINVSGTEYDITANQGSFNAIYGAGGPSTQPWFNDNTAALAFRNAWLSAATIADLPNGSVLYFTYNTNIDAFGAQNTGTLSFINITGLGSTQTSAFMQTLFYPTATLVTVDVPEINGNALAQMMLVLFVGGLFVINRRRRSDRLVWVTSRGT